MDGCVRFSIHWKRGRNTKRLDAVPHFSRSRPSLLCLTGLPLAPPTLFLVSSLGAALFATMPSCSLRAALPKSSGTRHWHWSFRVGAMVAELASLTAFLAMGMTYATQECGLSAIANAPLPASKGSVAVRFCYAGWDVISIPIVSPPTLGHTSIPFDGLLTYSGA